LSVPGGEGPKRAALAWQDRNAAPLAVEDARSPTPGARLPQQASVGSKTRSAVRVHRVQGGRRLAATVKGAGPEEVAVEVKVVGRHVEVDDELRQSATKKAERLGRYLAGMERAEVCFSDTHVGRFGDPSQCEVVLEGHGHVVRASAVGARQAEALDAAVERAALQLTRLKKRLVDRSRPRHANGKPYITAAGVETFPGEDTEDEGSIEGITEL
jgi:ribosomal subunit interface protein